MWKEILSRARNGAAFAFVGAAMIEAGAVIVLGCVGIAVLAFGPDVLCSKRLLAGMIVAVAVAYAMVAATAGSVWMMMKFRR